MKFCLNMLLILLAVGLAAADKYRGRELTPEQFESLFQEAAANLRVYDGKIFSVDSDGNFKLLRGETPMDDFGMVQIQIDQTSESFASVRLFFDKILKEESIEAVIINNRKEFWSGHSSKEVLVRVAAPKGKLPFRSTNYYALASLPDEAQFRHYINAGGLLYRAEEKISFDGPCPECKGDRFIISSNPSNNRKTRIACRICSGTGRGGQVKTVENVPIPPFGPKSNDDMVEVKFDKDFHGEVIGVRDGATLMLDNLDVHLYGVKAPEMNQEYGRESRRALSQLVVGEKVTVNYRVIDGKNYGNVYLGKKYINEIMLRQGDAWYDATQPLGVLKEAGEAAQEERLGWWKTH